MPLKEITPQRLYQQVAQQVAALIHSGEFQPGEKLPTERGSRAAAQRQPPDHP
ncbi:MAG: GntR family transcriptional regulator [Acetobacteraceae bacterium]